MAIWLHSSSSMNVAADRKAARFGGLRQIECGEPAPEDNGLQTLSMSRRTIEKNSTLYVPHRIHADTLLPNTSFAVAPRLAVERSESSPRSISAHSRTREP